MWDSNISVVRQSTVVVRLGRTLRVAKWTSASPHIRSPRSPIPHPLYMVHTLSSQRRRKWEQKERESSCADHSNKKTIRKKYHWAFDNHFHFNNTLHKKINFNLTWLYTTKHNITCLMIAFVGSSRLIFCSLNMTPPMIRLPSWGCFCIIVWKK